MKIPKLNKENQKAANALIVYLANNPGKNLTQVRLFLNSQKEKLKEYPDKVCHYKNYENILSYLYLTFSIRSEIVNGKRLHYVNTPTEQKKAINESAAVRERALRILESWRQESIVDEKLKPDTYKSAINFLPNQEGVVIRETFTYAERDAVKYTAKIKRPILHLERSGEKYYVVVNQDGKDILLSDEQVKEVEKVLNK